MQSPPLPPTSAALLACTALSVVLLLSLAVAIFEAIAAIKRKMNQRSAQSHQTNNPSSSDSNNNGDGVVSSVRCKKCSLSEFTWMRHLRQRTSESQRQFSTDLSPPQVSVSFGDPNVMAEVLLPPDLQSSSSFNNRPTVESFWTGPISQLNQMGPARFGSRPTRRISTPDNNFLHPTNHRSSKPCSPRRSYAGMTPYTTLPLTPGVMRLCGSLSDINEASSVEGEMDYSGNASLPRTLLAADNTASSQSTAVEARLKRIRLIRHR